MKFEKPLSIIIADDHSSVRYGIKSILKDIDFISIIDEAKDGSEVLKLISNQHYDVIFMDVRMPNMNGLLTTAIIKKSFPNIKVIALSMYDEVRYIREMFQNGAVGYLLKEAELEEIIEAIDEVSLGNKYLSRGISPTKMKYLNEEQPEQTSQKIRHEQNLLEVLYLIIKGKSSKQIGGIICLSKKMIDVYRRQLIERSGSENIAGLIKYGIKMGIDEDEILKNKFFKYFKK